MMIRHGIWIGSDSGFSFRTYQFSLKSLQKLEIQNPASSIFLSPTKNIQKKKTKSYDLKEQINEKDYSSLCLCMWKIRKEEGHVHLFKVQEL